MTVISCLIKRNDIFLQHILRRTYKFLSKLAKHLLSSFIAGLKPELDVRDGSFLELRVQVKGDPDPQITWTKDGKALSSSEILEVKYKNGVGTVTIKETFPEDGGKYSCKATNTKGSVETSCKVKITPMAKSANGKQTNGGAAATVGPRIYQHVISLVVKDGEPVKLECVVAGDAR